MPKDKSKYVKEEKPEKKAKSSGKGEKFADMSAGEVIIDEAALEKQLGENVKVEEKKEKQPKARGKNYLASKKQIDNTKTYNLKDAIELLKKISFAKTNGAVELHLNVIEKGIAGEAKLPHFEGKALKVAIFNDEVLEEIKAGKVNFEVLLATPADMGKIMPLAKILGPKGLLPNPKNGTIVPDPQKAAEKFSGNALRYKTEKDFPLIHTVIGKLSQPTEELAANISTLIKAVDPKRVKEAFLKSPMSPSIKIGL